VSKKGKPSIVSLLAKEFKAAGSPEEKRKLLNSTLNKWRELGNRQVSYFGTLLILVEISALIPFYQSAFRGNDWRGTVGSKKGCFEASESD
jgi:hypothetical protein